MHIAFFEIEAWETDYIKHKLSELGRKFVNLQVDFYHEKLSVRNAVLAKDCDAIAIFVYSQINEKLLELLPNLKFIVTMSTGYDHIDLKACEKRKILVTYVPSYGQNTVAEHAFALILNISRKVIECVERTRTGRFDTVGLRGFDLNQRTLGVIGTGRIGANVIRMAKGFGMNVIAFDTCQNEQLAKELGYKYVGLDTLLSSSDIITIHAVLSESSFHLINMKNINKVKRGAILINTARGGLVETAAMIHGLNRGILKAVGLDVLEEEGCIKEELQLLSPEFQKSCHLDTLLQNHLLLEKKNVYITPHNAFNSTEAIERIMDTTIDNLLSWMSHDVKNEVQQVVCPVK